MYDPIVEMALAIYHSKSRYALLLGSGISRAAGIPTGWEVMLQLANELSVASSVATLPDSADSRDQDAWFADFSTWFEGTFGTKATYSELVRRVAGSDSPDARQNMIKKIIEPQTIDTDSGSSTLRKPTKAHRAIAKLVKNGYVRIIITTNFDRLTETALADEGIVPKMFASSADLAGMPSMMHGDVFVLKIHGDYLNTDIRNTNEELSDYPNEIREVLKQVLDNFGLVISGWSGESDKALRDAISRSTSRRYNMFFTYRGSIRPEIDPMLNAHDARRIEVRSADELFESLEAKISALETINAPHPISVQMACEEVRRLLSAGNKIRLREFLLREATHSRKILDEYAASFKKKVRDEKLDYYLNHASIMTSKTAVFLNMLAQVSFYGTESEDKVLCEAMAIFSERTLASGDHDPRMWHLGIFPAIIGLISIGIPALIHERYSLLYKLLRETRALWHSASHRLVQLEELLSYHEAFANFDAFSINTLPAQTAAKCSVPILLNLHLSKTDFDIHFDKLEAILGLSRFYIKNVPTQQYSNDTEVWFGRYFDLSRGPLEAIEAELQEQSGNYKLLTSELFGTNDRINRLSDLIRLLKARKSNF